jgi:hypothetical protein
MKSFQLGAFVNRIKVYIIEGIYYLLLEYFMASIPEETVKPDSPLSLNPSLLLAPLYVYEGLDHSILRTLCKHTQVGIIL